MGRRLIIEGFNGRRKKKAAEQGRKEGDVCPGKAKQSSKARKARLKGDVA